MVQIDPISYYLIIPKLIDFILFIFLAFKIKNLRKNYILNQLYFTAMIGWGVYIFMDIFIWIVAAESSTWFIIGQILRDIQILGLMVLSFSIYQSQRVIRKGTHYLTKKRLIIDFSIYGILSIALIYFDGIELLSNYGDVILPERLDDTNFMNSLGIVRISPAITPIVAVISLVPVVIYIYSLIQQLIIAHSIKEKTLQKRMYILTIGFFCILAGVIYFILQNVFGWYGFFIVLVGYIFWGIAPILVWKSQSKKQAKEVMIS